MHWTRKHSDVSNDARSMIFELINISRIVHTRMTSLSKYENPTSSPDYREERTISGCVPGGLMRLKAVRDNKSFAWAFLWQTFGSGPSRWLQRLVHRVRKKLFKNSIIPLARNILQTNICVGWGAIITFTPYSRDGLFDDWLNIAIFRSRVSRFQLCCANYCEQARRSHRINAFSKFVTRKLFRRALDDGIMSLSRQVPFIKRRRKLISLSSRVDGQGKVW